MLVLRWAKSSFRVKRREPIVYHFLTLFLHPPPAPSPLKGEWVPASAAAAVVVACARDSRKQRGKVHENFETTLDSLQRQWKGIPNNTTPVFLITQSDKQKRLFELSKGTIKNAFFS